MRGGRTALPATRCWQSEVRRILSYLIAAVLGVAGAGIVVATRQRSPFVMPATTMEPRHWRVPFSRRVPATTPPSLSKRAFPCQ
jgi:ABC-type uncharacterized transport system permease subunit